MLSDHQLQIAYAIRSHTKIWKLVRIGHNWSIFDDNLTFQKTYHLNLAKDLNTGISSYVHHKNPIRRLFSNENVIFSYKLSINFENPEIKISLHK